MPRRRMRNEVAPKIVNTPVYFNAEEKESLKARAEQLEVSMGLLIRTVMREYLELEHLPDSLEIIEGDDFFK